MSEGEKDIESKRSLMYGKVALGTWALALILFWLAGQDLLSGLFSVAPGLVLATSFGLSLFGVLHLIKSFRAGESGGRTRITALIINGLVVFTFLLILVWNELLA